LSDSEAQKQAKHLRTMLSEKPPIPQEELERREQATRDLRARLIQIPWYAEQDRRDGMAFWRKLQASAVLSG